MADGDLLDARTGRGPKDNYATAANLSKRQALFSFLDPDASSGRPPIERIDWRGDETVLEPGCGNGLWLRAVAGRGVRRAIGLDLSSGMLGDARAAGTPAPLVAGDAQRLPFGDERFDVVLCFWMLYHVPDQEAALREVRRVLRPGGRLLAVTNSNQLRPLDSVITGALNEVTGQTRDRWTPGLAFNQENGAETMGRVFDRVEEERLVHAFAVPTPEPLLGTFESVRGPIEIATGATIDWDAAERVARSLIEAEIAREGTFRNSIHTASYLATK